MIEFSETKANLGISQIEEVEEFVGLRFPEEYEQHLLKYNGADANQMCFLSLRTAS